MAVTLVIIVFLDADGLTLTAERQQPGFERTVALSIIRPIRSLARGLHLTGARAWVAEVSGHRQSGDFTSTRGVRLAGQGRSATSRPGGAGGPSATTTTLPSYRVPTPADPLRVLVAGDSLSGYLGPALDKALSGLPAKVIADEHVGTGLARPDVVDWPREIQGDMDRYNPDVVVLFIGGNDDQDLRTPDGWLPTSNVDAWRAEYERRVAQIMNIVTRPGVTTYWLGLPPMAKAHLQQFVGTINSLIETEAAARPHQVVYVDTTPALAGPDGGFATYLPDDTGRSVQVRAPDGVHPTPAGMDRIVSLFVSKLIALRHLNTPPPVTTTTGSGQAGTTTTGER